MSGELEFAPGQVRALLAELTRRLDGKGIQGEIRVIGGAAMALRFPDDPSVRATRDIDAVYLPAPEVDRVILEMTRDLGLEPGWINSAAAPWLRVAGRPGSSSGFATIVATAEELAAMKLAAGREWDLTDLSIIARHLGLSDPEQLVDIAYKIYGEDSVELSDGRDSYRTLAESVIPKRQSPREPDQGAQAS